VSALETNTAIIDSEVRARSDCLEINAIELKLTQCAEWSQVAVDYLSLF